MRRLLLVLTFLFTLTLTAHAQQVATNVRYGATDPSTCAANVGGVFYNTTTDTLKVCTATNTWTALAIASSTVTANATVGVIPYLSAANTYSDSPLVRVDANTLWQRNSTTAQTFKVSQTYTSATTYRAVSLGITPLGRVGLYLDRGSAGTGTGTTLELAVESGSVPAGVNNGAGGALFLTGGASTGSANGGAVVFGVGFAGALGTQQNGIIEVARLNQEGFIVGQSGILGGILLIANATNSNRILLNGGTPAADRAIAFPDSAGTVALGTGATNQLAYWSATNTLTGSANITISAAGTILTLGDAATTDATIQLKGLNSQVDIYQGATLEWKVYSPNADSNFYIRDAVNSRMQITGAPGASSTAAITTLHSDLTAEGDAVTFSNAAYQSCVALTTNGSGLVGCTVSDRRLKNVGRAFDRGLEAVSQWKPVYYQFKPGTSGYEEGKRRVGFVAQQIARSTPEAVSLTGEGFLQIDPFVLIATLTNAVQQLEARVVELEKRK